MVPSGRATRNHPRLVYAAAFLGIFRGLLLDYRSSMSVAWRLKESGATARLGVQTHMGISLHYFSLL